MKKWEKLIGLKFGSLTFITMDKVGDRYKGRFKCECGSVTNRDLHEVTSGRVKSCGCLRSANISKGKIKHGLSKMKGRKESSEYTSWRAMKERCLNPKSKSYKDYGGRGIKVAKRWIDSFENFLTDMGYKPDSSYTIERVNPNWGYVPSNCKWVSKSVQVQNRRIKNINMIPGVEKTIKGRFRVAIGHNYKRTHIGTFDSIEQAKKARKEAELLYWNTI